VVIKPLQDGSQQRSIAQTDLLQVLAELFPDAVRCSDANDSDPNP
jgi:hypothetical protein